MAMLAATSLGAAWVSTSPDFGADAVLSRFEQVREHNVSIKLFCMAVVLIFRCGYPLSLFVPHN